MVLLQPRVNTFPMELVGARDDPQFLPFAELLEADGTDRGGAAAAGRVPARGLPCPGLVAARGQLPDGLQGLLLYRVLSPVQLALCADNKN